MPTRRPPSKETFKKATETLRRITALTAGLPDDSPVDARLRDRLELAADVLNAAAEAQE